MERKKIIIISVIALVIIILGAFWLLGGKNILSNILNKYIGKESIKEKLIPLNSTEDEKKLVEGRTEAQIRNDFSERKSLCANAFENGNISEMIEKYGVPKERAEVYFECQAISKEDIAQCDVLGENSLEKKICRQNFLKSVRFAFPALRQGKCDSVMISACQETETKDCENVCNALVNDFNRNCSGISFAPEHSACLALEQNNINPCDLLKEEMDKQLCQFSFFLVTAAKANNASLLEGIKIKESYLLAKLYFEKEMPCQELAAYIGQASKGQCDSIFNENSLNRLLEVGRDLRGDYKNKMPEQNN